MDPPQRRFLATQICRTDLRPDSCVLRHLSLAAYRPPRQQFLATQICRHSEPLRRFLATQIWHHLYPPRTTAWRQFLATQICRHGSASAAVPGDTDPRQFRLSWTGTLGGRSYRLELGVVHVSILSPPPLLPSLLRAWDGPAIVSFPFRRGLLGLSAFISPAVEPR